MTQYILRRLLALIPVLLGVSIVVFSLIRMIPGDPVIVMLGERARPQDIERVREEMGFNRPIYIQYLEWMGACVQGDLGTSIINRTPVMDELKYRLAATIEMVIAGLIIGAVVGISVGIISAIRRNSWIDLSATVGALIGVSMPIYWLALILIYALAVNRQIFPPSARLDVDLTVVRRTGFMLIDTLLMGDLSLFRQRRLASDAAGPGVEHRGHADPRPADPGQHARSHGPGLRAHGRRQGAAPQGRHHSPRVEERAAAHHHGCRACSSAGCWAAPC